MKKQIVAAAITSLMALSMASTAHAQVYVRVAPPAPIVEVVPPPPHEHPGWAWHPGYHRWDGERYVWVPGVYEEPPRGHHRWIAGHWVNGRDGYVWHEGHWS
jgi:hypothetical protein